MSQHIFLYGVCTYLWINNGMNKDNQLTKSDSAPRRDNQQSETKIKLEIDITKAAKPIKSNFKVIFSRLKKALL